MALRARKPQKEKKERALTSLEQHILEKKLQVEKEIAEYILLTDTCTRKHSEFKISGRISEGYIESLENLIAYFKKQPFPVEDRIRQLEAQASVARIMKSHQDKEDEKKQKQEKQEIENKE